MQQFARTVAAIDDAARARGELAAAQRVTRELSAATARLQELPGGPGTPSVEGQPRTPALSPLWVARSKGCTTEHPPVDPITPAVPTRADLLNRVAQRPSARIVGEVMEIGTAKT